MSTDPTRVDPGPLINNPQLVCKSVEAADELIQMLLKIKNSGDPGILVFRICRFENIVMVFEIYRDQEAFKAHANSESFAVVKAELPRLLAQPIRMEFYKEVEWTGAASPFSMSHQMQ